MTQINQSIRDLCQKREDALVNLMEQNFSMMEILLGPANAASLLQEGKNLRDQHRKIMNNQGEASG